MFNYFFLVAPIKHCHAWNFHLNDKRKKNKAIGMDGMTLSGAIKRYKTYRQQKHDVLTAYHDRRSARTWQATAWADRAPGQDDQSQGDQAHVKVQAKDAEVYDAFARELDVPQLKSCDDLPEETKARKIYI